MGLGKTVSVKCSHGRMPYFDLDLNEILILCQTGSIDRIFVPHCRALRCMGSIFDHFTRINIA